MDNEEKGILVEQVVQADRMKTNGRLHERLFLALRFLYFLMGMLGVALGLTLTYGVSLNYPLLVLGVVLICLVVTAAWVLPVHKGIVWPVLFGVYLVLGFILHRMLLDGMMSLYNTYAEQINSYYSSKLSLAAIGAVSDQTRLVCVLYLMVLFAAGLSLGTIRSLDGRATAFVFAVPFVMALAVGMLPAMLPLILMVLVLIGMFFLQYSRYRESLSVRTVTVRMSSGVFSMLRWQTAAAASGIFLLMLPIGYFGLGPALTEGYEAQSEIREDIRNGDLLKSAENFWKKLTRGEWDWLPVDIIRSSGVHGGKLSNVKEIRDYGETHLYLDISSDLQAPLYIRGYVGSNYTGSGWKELTDSQNEAGLDSGMDVISLSEQYYSVLHGLYNQQDESVVRRDLVITVADANSSFSYIPYGTSLNAYTPGEPFDAYTREDTDREIFSMYYMNTQRLSNIRKLEAAGAASSADTAYRGFADSVYLELPEKGLDRFYAEYAGKQFNSVADCAAFVRSTLEAHAVYTKTPGATPGGNDYVEYFLYENQQGVCTHFASAAVLLFRLYGIPARYVEGYLVQSLDSEQGAQAIMDSEAHAWAEIYIDGAGWIPIEVTPGFISEDDLQDDGSKEDSTISSDQLEDVTNPEKETQTEVQTEEPQATVEGVFPTETEPTQEPTQPPSQPQSQTQPQNQNHSQEETNQLWKMILKIVLVIIAVILVLALAVCFIIYQRKVRLQHQEQRLRGEPKAALLYALGRMDALCEAEGLPGISNAEDAQLLQKSFPTMTQERLMWLQDLLQELTFSNHVYGSELRDETAVLYREMASDALRKKGRIRRLWYRYGRCFI